jgi:hypothetical protein
MIAGKNPFREVGGLNNRVLIVLLVVAVGAVVVTGAITLQVVAARHARAAVAVSTAPAPAPVEDVPPAEPAPAPEPAPPPAPPASADALFARLAATNPAAFVNCLSRKQADKLNTLASDWERTQAPLYALPTHNEVMRKLGRGHDPQLRLQPHQRERIAALLESFGLRIEAVAGDRIHQVFVLHETFRDQMAAVQAVRPQKQQLWNDFWKNTGTPLQEEIKRLSAEIEQAKRPVDREFLAAVQPLLTPAQQQALAQ